jgi:4-hydroxythreonine-4-phosphate dehydrogenase
MGDPAGISPELTARLIALDESRAAARLVVFGDRRILAAGAAVAGVSPDVEFVSSGAVPGAKSERPIFVDLGHLAPDEVIPATAAPEGGRFASENFRHALRLAQSGATDAVLFTPFNKKAMRFAYPGYDDEIRFVNDVLGLAAEASEFNVLGGLWNARVTSHIPLSAVAAALSEEAILSALALTSSALRAANIATPRIAVAGINPHAGDGGSFGREEIDIIAPAIAKATAKGIDASGPFPADTVFLRAKSGAFDAVLTMYHDQGQIAMKLMGFDRGVTLLGGFPFPICTPAHGTAYDIAGRGIADIGASREALLLAARMAAIGRAARVPAARRSAG